MTDLKRASYYIRCATCGRGVEEGRAEFVGYDENLKERYERTPDVHVDLDSGEQAFYVDHEPVVDNKGPDGETYPFGRIEDTVTIGPYAIVRSWSYQGDEVKQSYTVYLYLPATEYRQAGWRRQINSWATLQEALVFAVAAHAKEENSAAHLARHFVAGLGL